MVILATPLGLSVGKKGLGPEGLKEENTKKCPKHYFRKTMVLTMAMKRTSNADKNTGVNHC